MRGLYTAAYLAVLGALAAAVYAVGVDGWRLVTFLGGMAFYMGVSPILFHHLGPRLGSGLMASILVTAAATDLAKHVLNLPRPPEEQWLAPAEGPGFPSGHSSVSASFWVFTALALPSVYTGVLAVYMPTLIGLSRIELGVHYPRDVGGGLLLGMTIALAARAASSRLSPLALMSSSLIITLLLEAPSMGRYEIPAAALGVLVGLAAYKRLSGGWDRALGWRLGLAGSMASIALGGLALASWIYVLRVALVFLAALAAIVIPLILARYTAIDSNLFRIRRLRVTHLRYDSVRSTM